MDGVTILNEFEVVTKTVFSWESFWIGAILGAAFAILVVELVMASDWDWSCFGLICGIFIPIVSILFALYAGFLIAPTLVEYETHYEVSINEEVNMQEFMSTYEIIETRGSIYTVREKCE